LRLLFRLPHPTRIGRRRLLLATAASAALPAGATVLNRPSPSLPDPAGGDGLLYPAAFIESPEVRRLVIAIDASQSQLHLLERIDGRWLRKVSYPVAMGRKGVGKIMEGDQRTPLGIYEIVDRHEGSKLAPIYGPGALVLDYPNDLDRREGRTGSNIWIHGMPAERASAPTRSSSGCIVLANAHVQALMATLGTERVPVLIAKQLEWVHPTSSDPEARVLRRQLETWRQARSGADAQATWAMYASAFANSGESADLWRRGIERELVTTGPQERQIKNLSIVAWDERIRLVTFHETLQGMRRGLLHRQYWSAEEGEWRIFSEGIYE
jgi:murein L,D-transpeptidase YafK